MSKDTLQQSGFDSHPKLKALKPDFGIFECGKGFAILNCPTDALDYIRSGQVTVYRQDLSHMSDHGIHLADGIKLDSDALVASTGWLAGPAINFQPTRIHSELGIPSTEYSDEQKAFQKNLDQKADTEIFQRWPSLKTLKYPPRADENFNEIPLDERGATKEPHPKVQPLRLYRSLVPPGLAAKGDRSLAVAGLSANLTNHIRNEIAGLWIYAYMNDELTVDPCRNVKDVYWETALFTRFCYRRHPYGFGSRFPGLYL